MSDGSIGEFQEMNSWESKLGYKKTKEYQFIDFAFRRLSDGDGWFSRDALQHHVAHINLDDIPDWCYSKRERGRSEYVLNKAPGRDRAEYRITRDALSMFLSLEQMEFANLQTNRALRRSTIAISISIALLLLSLTKLFGAHNSTDIGRVAEGKKGSNSIVVDIGSDRRLVVSIEKKKK